MIRLGIGVVLGWMAKGIIEKGIPEPASIVKECVGAATNAIKSCRIRDKKSDEEEKAV